MAQKLHSTCWNKDDAISLIPLWHMWGVGLKHQVLATALPRKKGFLELGALKRQQLKQSIFIQRNTSENEEKYGF